MNAYPSSTNHGCRYHRYCNHCGLGFSRHAWLESTFCSYCGQQLAKDSHGDVHGNARPAKRGRKPGNRSCPTCRRRSDGPDGSTQHLQAGPEPSVRNSGGGSWTVEAPAPHGSGLSDKVSKGICIVQQHPYTCALAGVATGAACIAGGGVITTVGAELVGLGVGITTRATVPSDC